MKKQKEKIEFVRHDALEEEVKKNNRTESSKPTAEIKVDPCQKQAQQWF